MKTRLEKIQSKIRQTAIACGRNPESVKLVAVSKTKPSEMVEEAIRAGADLFGENYIQEAAEKISELKSYPVSWHFIGHLQSNKAKVAVPLFDLIHSVDSVKLAKEINRQALKAGKVQKILVQINISREESKSGVDAEDTVDFMRELSLFENISVRGLMAMPPFFSDPEKARPFFVRIRKIRDRIIEADIPNIRMDELSMGMSGDYKAAIEEGSTLVRIGTAIFGRRD